MKFGLLVCQTRWNGNKFRSSEGKKCKKQKRTHLQHKVDCNFEFWFFLFFFVFFLFFLFFFCFFCFFLFFVFCFFLLFFLIIWFCFFYIFFCFFVFFVFDFVFDFLYCFLIYLFFALFVWRDQRPNFLSDHVGRQDKQISTRWIIQHNIPFAILYGFLLTGERHPGFF